MPVSGDEPPEELAERLALDRQAEVADEIDCS